jgi:hypothetical protein
MVVESTAVVKIKRTVWCLARLCDSLCLHHEKGAIVFGFARLKIEERTYSTF